MSSVNLQSAVVAGAGPAGLTIAYELLERRSGVNPVVFEASRTVGGAAKTIAANGLRLDVGGHRFFARNPRTQAWFNRHREAAQMLSLKRSASVYYHRKFSPYPLRLDIPTMGRLGAKFAIEASWGWIANKLSREKVYVDERFTKSFSSPLWQLDRKRYFAERETSAFQYPRLGPGQFWEHIRSEIERMGGFIETENRVTKLFFGSDRRFISAEVTNGWNEKHIVPGDYLVSTIPMGEMIGMMEGLEVPREIQTAARLLTHRRFFSVGVLVPRRHFTHLPPSDNLWVYIQDRDVEMGRVRMLDRWSTDLGDDNPENVWMAIDYFPAENADLAYLTPDAMIGMAVEELSRLAHLPAGAVIKTVCAREDYAYPSVNRVSRSQMLKIRHFLNSLPNTFVIGRNGQHARYGMSHSALSAIRAADIILSGAADAMDLRESLWDINLEIQTSDRH